MPKGRGRVWCGSWRMPKSYTAKEMLKGNRMDEELKKQSCVENREGVNLMKMGYWGKTWWVINLKNSRLEPDPRGLNPDKGSWRLFLEGEQLKHLNQRHDPIKVCFRKISLTVLLVRATFSLEERERKICEEAVCTVTRYGDEVWTRVVGVGIRSEPDSRDLSKRIHGVGCTGHGRNKKQPRCGT